MYNYSHKNKKELISAYLSRNFSYVINNISLDSRNITWPLFWILSVNIILKVNPISLFLKEKAENNLINLFQILL